MSRHLRHPKYTYQKDNIYYFSRSVPVDLRPFYTRPRIVQSLKTSCSRSANQAASYYSAKLDNYCLGLRLNTVDIPAAHLLCSNEDVDNSSAPTIEEALKIYFAVVGKDKRKLFFTTAERYIGYLIKCLGSRPLDCYSTKDATILRSWSMDKGLSNASLNRVFSGIKAVINFVIREQGLDISNPFSKVYIPTDLTAKKRRPVSEDNLLKLKKECYSIDDDIRWLVALITDTGLRLSEAAGLMIDDIKLESPLPYLYIRPHPHRRLKTASSERKIPLVDTSLWAAKRLKKHCKSLYCFPRYTNEERCNSNSASASINKWIKTIANKDDVIHGLRHSFRDRLRSIETPPDMIDQLGGWTLRSIGQGYGDGYSLELMQSYLEKMAYPAPC